MIEVSRYTLRSRGALNARSERREFAGALLRVNGGYGCLHPWPELGDRPLEVQLAALKARNPTVQTKQTLACCSADGEARRFGLNLFAGLQMPPSHFTLPDFWDEPIPAGFTTVKLKSASQIPDQRRLRFDFNGTSTPAQVAELLPYRSRIDFIEDPFPYTPSTWRSTAEDFALASDRYGEIPEATFRILKPALEKRQTNKWPVYTSYMDHPIGQLYAAWIAAQDSALGEVHGLVTHHLFDDADPFIAAMGPPVPILVPPPGTGLGFDDLLPTLAWSPL